MSAQDYNYRHFDPRGYDPTAFPGPRPGEKAVDFEAETLEGERVRLSDFFGRPIVLEAGSISCMMYVRNIPTMTDLARRYPDVQFLVLYVREAHPGHKIGPHASQEEKRQRARETVNAEGENRTVLIDDVDGTAHRRYGLWPNFVYVIDAEGVVRMRGDWSKPEKVEQVLAALDSGKVVGQEFYPPKPAPMALNWRVLRRAGLDAAWDFVTAMPALLRMHRKKREHEPKRA